MFNLTFLILMSARARARGEEIFCSSKKFLIDYCVIVFSEGKIYDARQSCGLNFLKKTGQAARGIFLQLSSSEEPSYGSRSSRGESTGGTGATIIPFVSRIIISDNAVNCNSTATSRQSRSPGITGLSHDCSPRGKSS